MRTLEERTHTARHEAAHAVAYWCCGHQVLGLEVHDEVNREAYGQTFILRNTDEFIEHYDLGRGVGALAGRVATTDPDEQWDWWDGSDPDEQGVDGDLGMWAIMSGNWRMWPPSPDWPDDPLGWDDVNRDTRQRHRVSDVVWAWTQKLLARPLPVAVQEEVLSRLLETGEIQGDEFEAICSSHGLRRGSYLGRLGQLHDRLLKL